MPAKQRLLGLTWGIHMTQQDLNNYLLYCLLLTSSPETVDCESFLKYYTVFSMINTGLTLLFAPISGWLTDLFEPRSGLFFSVVSLLQIVMLIVQLILSYLPEFEKYGYIWLCIAWQTRQLLSLQGSNSLWLIIKQQTVHIADLNDGFHQKDKLKKINKIGNTGDLCSDTIEASVLVSLVLLSYYLDIGTKFAGLFIGTAILILNVILVLLSLLYVKRTKFELTYENNNMIEAEKINIFRHMIDSAKKFYHEKIGFHAFWHCIILNIFIIFAQYPISLLEVTNLVDLAEYKVADNMCGGVLTNLLALGAMTNCSYLIGSIWYFLFIVRCPPKYFYSIWYPIGSLILLGCTMTLWFTNIKYLVLALIAVSQIVPYYLTYYDYYLFTERTVQDYYGFVLGIYTLSTGLTTLLVQAIFLINFPFWGLLVSCLILLTISLIYSYYLAWLTI